MDGNIQRIDRYDKKTSMHCEITMTYCLPCSGPPLLQLGHLSNQIRDLVDVENSHREACQINIRAWTNLAKFMVTSEEPARDLVPFKDWHDSLTTQIIRQRAGAKEEAYAQAADLSHLEGNAVSSTLLQSVIEKNERQVEVMLSEILFSSQTGFAIGQFS